MSEDLAIGMLPMPMQESRKRKRKLARCEGARRRGRWRKRDVRTGHLGGAGGPEKWEGVAQSGLGLEKGQVGSPKGKMQERWREKRRVTTHSSA